MSKHKNKRKTTQQKYRLREGSFKRSLRRQLNQEGNLLFQDGNIDTYDINASRKTSKANRISR